METDDIMTTFSAVNTESCDGLKSLFPARAGSVEL